MYEIMPLLDTPERAHIMEELLRKTCKFDTAFSDFQDVCEEKCFETKPLPEMCDICKLRMQLASVGLVSGLVWEVWRADEDVELVGFIRLSDIKPGQDAKGHYIFFDHDLRGKTAVIREVMEWAFSEHEGWEPLRRLSIEVPDFAFALVRHATKKLGFGGPFMHSMHGKKIPVEGVKRAALNWKGKQRDLLMLGLLNPALK